MMDAFLARYGTQDIHRLRGVEELTPGEKEVFRQCLLELLRAEVEPLPGGGSGGG
jgi:hypothetical protein